MHRDRGVIARGWGSGKWGRAVLSISYSRWEVLEPGWANSVTVVNSTVLCT